MSGPSISWAEKPRAKLPQASISYLVKMATVYENVHLAFLSDDGTIENVSDVPFKVEISKEKTNTVISILNGKPFSKVQLFFGSFGLSTKEPYTIMLCPSSSLASSCIGVSIVYAHLPLTHG